MESTNSVVLYVSPTGLKKLLLEAAYSWILTMVLTVPVEGGSGVRGGSGVLLWGVHGMFTPLRGVLVSFWGVLVTYSYRFLPHVFLDGTQHAILATPAINSSVAKLTFI